MSIDELEAAVMQLPPDERERLGEKLLASVDTPLEYEDEWAAEADRRIEELLNGTVGSVPGNEVLQSLGSE